MKSIRGLIARRLLINYRCDPAVVQALLPPQLRPKLQSGYAVAGICLIRLEQMRPSGFPAVLGAASENAAHRFAVLDEQGGEGVYIPRRDTSSLLNATLGGLAFPVEQHRAHFDVQDDGESVSLSMDGEMALSVSGRHVDMLPDSSIFGSIEESSEFFREGSVGIAPNGTGVELITEGWSVQPFGVTELQSRYFEAFEHGSVAFDHALIMRNVAHEWRAVPS